MKTFPTPVIAKFKIITMVQRPISRERLLANHPGSQSDEASDKKPGEHQANDHNMQGVELFHVFFVVTARA
jgi:hypothetical protein